MLKGRRFNELLTALIGSTRNFDQSKKSSFFSLCKNLENKQYCIKTYNHVMVITNAEPIIYFAWKVKNELQITGIEINKVGQIHCLPDQMY